MYIKQHKVIIGIKKTNLNIKYIANNYIYNTSKRM